MRIEIGLENNFNGRSLAWALDYPGCFVYGAEASEALMGIPRALIAYQTMIEKHTSTPWVRLGDFDIRLVQAIDDPYLDENYQVATEGRLVQAFFQHDWKPLSRVEVDHSLQLLKWGRAEMLDLLAKLDEGQLAYQPEGERWSVQGIAAHLATAEWWLLDRLDLAADILPRAALEKDVLTRMTQTRAVVEKALPDLAGLEKVVGREGELWSPRKVVRRLLWHERDHIQHIQKLLVQKATLGK